MSNIINVCGLWIKKSSKGTTFMVGNAGNLSYMIFKNEKKTAENQPDYTLNIAEARKPEVKKEVINDSPSEIDF